MPDRNDKLVTVFVCITCGSQDVKPDETNPGQRLFDAVIARCPEDAPITITPIKCLAVCKRACTVALSGPGKWTAIVGDLDPEGHAGDVIDAALSHAATQDGIVPWRQRPLSFRRGVVARVPPLGFQPAEPE